MTALSETQTKTLIALLDAIRHENANRGTPRTMVSKPRPEPATT